MKILINGYLKQLPKGQEAFSGPRNFVGTFLDYLDKSNFEYTCLVVQGKKVNDNKISKKRLSSSKNNSWLIAKLRLNTNDIFFAKKPGIPRSLLQPLENFKKIITQEKPDVVIVQGMSISNWYIARAAHELGIPVVSSHLGLWYKEISNYQNATKGGIAIMNEMERDLTRFSTRELFLTELSYQHYNRQLIKVPKKQLRFLPLPYDPVFLNKTLPSMPPSKVIKVGTVGRWDPIKNHEAILKLAQEAKRQNLPIEFYAVTTIHKEYPWSREIRDTYPEYVHVLPPMTPKELKKFYQDMHVLILPSHFDVSPTVVIEAALQNRYTIISPNVGWVTIYKKLGLSHLITSFANPAKTLALITQVTQKAPTKAYVNYYKDMHKPERAFKLYLDFLKEAYQEKLV